MYLIRSLGARAAAAVFNIDLPVNAAMHDLTMQEAVQLFIGAYAAQSLGVIAYLWLERRSPSPQAPRPFGFFKAPLAGALALLLAWPVVLTVAELAARLLQAPPSAIAHQTLHQLVETQIDAWWIVMAALVIVAAPIIEELMYRGLLQRALHQLSLGRWPAIIAASLIFALMHLHAVPPHAVAALFVLSLGFGWIYEKTGSLAAPITMHALFNAGNLAFALLGSKA